MGDGYSYTCKKCNHKYWVFTGAVMMFPTVYRDTLNAIAKGKYGSKLQELFNSTPYAAINAADTVYICGECDSWEYAKDLTLYAPNNPDDIPQKQYGIKTVAEWGYVPYVTRRDLEKEYHVVKRCYHHCSKCGKRMHKASLTELVNLPCPKCGSANQAEGEILLE